MARPHILMTGILLLASTASTAELSRTLTFTTDYVFRGISNTSGAPAIQGAFDYAHDNGAYAGIWATNVKFRENAAEAAIDAVDEASLEVDYYAGFSADASDSISWDVGIINMTYPGAEPSLNYNYLEAYGLLYYSLNATPLSPELGLELYHSNNYFEHSGAASYVNANLSLSLPYDLSLSMSAGHSTFNDSPVDDYTDYSIAISTELDGFELKLNLTATDISKLNCGDDTCESRLVFSVSSSM